MAALLGRIRWGVLGQMAFCLAYCVAFWGVIAWAVTR